ncbi:MAG: DUF1513 domain-containing protein [Geminicoccaceae bacterium]
MTGGLDRRALLGGLALGLVASRALAAGAARGSAGALYVGCRRLGERYEVAGFDLGGDERFALELPDRGHSLALHPTRPIGVAFARRPGRFAVVFDYAEGAALLRIDAAPGRHFYGHGAFSPDGRWLFATQNDWASGKGVVAILDAAAGFAPAGEIESHGISPHELRLLPDGRTLAIANGGIRTHPDRDREKLNLDTMRPSLTLVEAAGGRLEADFALAPAWHQLSIRHLDVAADGRIAIAMQHEGGKGDVVPLVGLVEGGTLRTFDASAAMAKRLRHYIGSVVFDATGSVIAASAPRAGRITLWDAATGALLADHPVPDGCGIAPAGPAGSFIATGGAGARLRLEANGSATPLPPGAPADWDHHLMRTEVRGFATLAASG